MKTKNRLYRADRPDRFKNILETIGTIIWKPDFTSRYTELSLYLVCSVCSYTQCLFVLVFLVVLL